MTYDGPIDQLTRHLAARSSGAGNRDALRRLAAAGIPLGAALTLSALASSCHPPAPPGHADVLISALGRLVPQDDDATLCLLVALRPGMVNLARRHAHATLDRDTAEREVIAACFERAATLAAAPDPVTARAVIGGARSRLRTQRRTEGRIAERTVPLTVGPEVTEHGHGGPDPSEQIEALLAAAVDASAITPAAAAVVRATRLQGMSLSELAVASGTRVQTLHMTRSRAEQRLADYWRGTLPPRTASRRRGRQVRSTRGPLGR